MSNRLVLTGGFATPLSMLELVGNALVETGAANDIDIFTLLDAYRHPDRLHLAAQGVGLMMHSSGVWVARGARPDWLIACNGPEGRSSVRLAVGVLHHAHDTVRHSELRYKKLAAGVITEFMRHSTEYLAIVPELHNFSTVNMLRAAHDDGIDSTYVYMTGDRVCPYRATDRPIPFKVQKHEGRHDELLYHPDKVVGAIFNYSQQLPDAA